MEDRIWCVVGAWVREGLINVQLGVRARNLESVREGKKEKKTVLSNVCVPPRICTFSIIVPREN